LLKWRRLRACPTGRMTLPDWPSACRTWSAIVFTAQKDALRAEGGGGCLKCPEPGVSEAHGAASGAYPGCRGCCVGMRASRRGTFASCQEELGRRRTYVTYLVGRSSRDKINSARGAVCVIHCRTEFMKQVFPRFAYPAPILRAPFHATGTSSSRDSCDGEGQIGGSGVVSPNARPLPLSEPRSRRCSIPPHQAVIRHIYVL